MKIVTFDVRTMKDRIVSEESTITIETLQGRFAISERGDGSLAIELHAIASPNFRTEPQ